MTIEDEIRIRKWEFYRIHIRPKIKWWYDLRKWREQQQITKEI